MANPLFRIEDYRPPDYLVDHVDLDVALDPAITIVRSILQIRRAGGVSPDRPLRLDGLHLDLIAIAIDGEILALDRFTVGDGGIVIRDLPHSFTLMTRVRICPEANRSALGLFFLDGKLATQCEAEGFRRITFFPDRPDVLARYTVRLEADKARFPTLLSNGNPAGAGDLPDGRHWTAWTDPYPKPCYIFGLFAGDFAQLQRTFTTASGRDVAVTIHANADVIGDCSFAMAALMRAMAWDETAFGLEYDLDVYNVVALEGWGGATENKGLNLFGASGIVADASITTDDEFITIERIIGHEQFHNWTGNRVTCRDWFQLALKEGLTRYRDQCFMESRLGAGPWRIEMVRALRRNQFPEDDGPSAHPVQPRHYADIDNFYTATVYEKGAELVRMLATILGADGFCKGIALYLDLHDGQAVTVDAFLAAMEEAGGRDLRLFRRWYDRAGRPHIEAEGDYDAAAQSYTLTLRQTGAGDAPLLLPVRLALFDRDGARVAEDRVVEMSQPVERIVFNDMPSDPVPSLLRGFSAPVTLVMDRPDADLALLVAHDDDAFARWDAAQTLAIRVIRAMSADPAMAPSSAFVDVFGALLTQRTDPYLLSQLVTLPDEPVLSEGLAEIPLDAHLAARDRLRSHLATICREALYDRYRRYDDAPDGFDGIGARKLRGACLDLLGAVPDPELLGLMRDQVLTGATMTDRFAALSSLVHIPCAERDEALRGFYNQWVDRPAVIDKWFSAQALSRAPGAVDAIIALEQHPAFTFDNMSRLLAYYGGFFRQNRVAFHDLSGKGYAFLADRLLAMDAMGRGGSFWVMPQINQWRRHDPVRRTLMQTQLERIAGTAGISAGLRESVETALR